MTYSTAPLFLSRYTEKCNGLLALAKKYGRSRLEHASMMMKEETDASSYKVLCNMLNNNRDLVCSGEEFTKRTPFSYNLRGFSAYTSISLLGKKADHE